MSRTFLDKKIDEIEETIAELEKEKEELLEEYAKLEARNEPSLSVMQRNPSLV